MGRIVTYSVADTLEIDQNQRKNPEIPNRIQRLLDLDAKGTIQIPDKRKAFLSSIDEYFKKRKELTIGQYKYLSIIEGSYTDEQIKSDMEWFNSFDQEKREDLVLLAKIYEYSNKIHRTSYFKSLIDEILQNDSFVPSRFQYENFVSTKFGVGYLNNYKYPPRYKKQSFVEVRTSKRANFKHAIVIDYNHEYPTDYGKGGKKYLILPFGEFKAVTVKEREIKFSSLTKHKKEK